MMGKTKTTRCFVNGDSAGTRIFTENGKTKPGIISTILTCRSLWPYLWPQKNRWLQLNVVLCILILIVTRGISVLAPMSYKKVINSFSEPELSDANRWKHIVAFILLKSLQGNHGYLSCLRSFLWIGVSQNSKKQLRINLFAHIMNLSLRWHLQRKTGEVLRVMDRGVDSVNLILSQVLFNLLPAVLDVCIAIVFFLSVIDWWAGVIIFISMIGYLSCTLVLSKWRAHFRRERNTADNQRTATIVDSILNFETVKYYAAEAVEIERYSEALDRHRSAEWRQNVAANLLNTGQRTMMMAGLMAGTLLYSHYVATGKFTVGDYVLYATYVEQLYGPLNTFGTYYKKLQQAFVDMENMFDILNEKEEVADLKTATPLDVSEGKVAFENVSFHYTPEKPILKNISFVVTPGQTVAIVGPSGSGKSTLIRLLLKFYEPQIGAIFIDNTDIRNVLSNSLRSQIGVVPQDPVLFNTDLLHNIRYALPSASDDDVKRAASIAEIHGRIESFPGQYLARVGERGLKLSGGEKQAVAIARTVLKTSNIFLMDEATSSVDSKTEGKIFSNLSGVLTKRTKILISHRLSTIVAADLILVMKEGEIIERGTHTDLLQVGGEYAHMWRDQLEKYQCEDKNDSKKEPGVWEGQLNRADNTSPEQTQDARREFLISDVRRRKINH